MADFGNDLADFEAKVQQNKKALNSKKAEVRREAALWLGESGEPPVIEALVKLYEREKDSSVRAAVESSLGKFRALEKALDRGEEDKVLALLKRVANEGIIGALYNAMYGEDPEVREAAFYAIEDIGANGFQLPHPNQFGLG